MAAGNRPNRNRPNRNRPNKGGGRLRDRAVTDVQLMMQPQFDYNNAQLQQTQENYLRAQQAAQAASGGAYDAIGEARNPGFDRIADQFTQNLNALAPEFGGVGAQMPYTANSIYGERGGTIGMPENEVAAGNALGGAIGSAGLSGLANDDARWGMLREGAQREASTFGRNAQAALQSQMMDTLRQHENEQQNLMAQQPYQIKSRLDELKDQAIEQQLAKSKMRSDAAFSQAIQDQISGITGGFGGGGGGGGGGGRIRPSGNAQVGQNPVTGFGGTGGLITDPVDGTPTHPAAQPPTSGERIQNKVGNVLATHEFQDLPGWLRSIYQHAPANRWDMVEGRPQRAQVFRRTRPHVRSLYTAAHPGGYVAPGAGFFGGR